MSALAQWLGSPVFTLFGAATSRVELIGFATGGACVWLAARVSVWNWPIGLVNNVAFFVLFLGTKLYADAGLQVVFFVLGVAGWAHWARGATAEEPSPVLSMNGRDKTLLAIAEFLGFAGIGWLLVTASDSPTPLWDAALTTLSLLATWAQIRKQWEMWLLWIATDVVSVPLYLHKHLALTALLYCGFLAICLYGLALWLRKARAAAPA